MVAAKQHKKTTAGICWPVLQRVWNKVLCDELKKTIAKREDIVYTI
ncbi:hypothetical protein SCACP_40700 [Sporomusa carbonis]